MVPTDRCTSIGRNFFKTERSPTIRPQYASLIMSVYAVNGLSAGVANAKPIALRRETKDNTGRIMYCRPDYAPSGLEVRAYSVP